MFNKGLKDRTIWYFLPDYDQPSWGGGMLYHHVDMLNRNGFNAVLLHEEAPFKLDWLQMNVPVKYLNQGEMKLSKGDVIVVPEALVEDKRMLDASARKIVFAQNCFLMLLNLKKACTYKDLGYEHAFTYLPHLHKIIKQHFDIEITDIPPFVASYFYLDPKSISQCQKKKQIVFFPKAGSYDYDLILKLLQNKIEKMGPALASDSRSNRHEPWEILELKGKTHRQVADAFRQASIFVCLNTHEAFNSSVPEAMAAGALVLCYEAYGPGDFLENQKNAFVFGNNHAYPLIDKLFEIMDNYDVSQGQIAFMRRNAYETACQFSGTKTERALKDFFRNF